MVAELDGRIVFANPEVERLAGRALVDLHIDDLVEPEQSGLVAAWFESMSVGVAGRSVYLGALPVTWDGVDRWIEMSGREILAVDGFRGVVVALRDVTEHQQQLEALEYHLGHDELTGLINRSALQQHLALLAAGPDTSVVMFLDLDNFKLINDAYGHHVGDELLIAFAARLRSAVPDAVVGRQGGDEFVVSVPATGLEQGVELARQVSGLLAEPYRLAGGRVTCTASIGVAVLDRSVEDSLREADVALYRAKRDGRNQVAPYDDETRTWADRRWDIEVEVAALNERLKQLGHDAAKELDERLVLALTQKKAP